MKAIKRRFERSVSCWPIEMLAVLRVRLQGGTKSPMFSTSSTVILNAETSDVKPFWIMSQQSCVDSFLFSPLPPLPTLALEHVINATKTERGWRQGPRSKDQRLRR